MRPARISRKSTFLEQQYKNVFTFLRDHAIAGLGNRLYVTHKEGKCKFKRRKNDLLFTFHRFFAGIAMFENYALIFGYSNSSYLVFEASF